MTDCVRISTTADRTETLEAIARQLLEKQLAACIQISGPILSLYRWHGKIEQADEWVCDIKTTSAKTEAVIKLVIQCHTYDTPEVTVTPYSGGSVKYLQWLADQVNP